MQSATTLRLLAASFFFALFVGTGRAEMAPVTPLGLDTALSDAQALVAGRANFEVMRVEGRSMLPFFGQGSVLVVKKISSAKLRAGMVVVYQNRFGDTVAHRVIAAAQGGCTVRGYNNDEADSTVVNDANLLGVVYATFHSNGQSQGGAEFAALLQGTKVAMAAPAR